ncbi:hypothetical protein [Neisseria montereyensis]|uniref:Uncharacterized protein n=1 Tax=Neisseria montereyensis TaxID=2973938 RepID=A0ABT2FEU2_9NEIS|nr:hypothetical protein [Neisseria montereyensis]MCS4534739.1 hypothetical protein [Neisseria montereyensis]
MWEIGFPSRPYCQNDVSIGFKADFDGRWDNAQSSFYLYRSAVSGSYRGRLKEPFI